MAIERLHTIKNFHGISPEVGTAGQPIPEQFADIAEARYESVINIDSATAVPTEDELVTSKRMHYIHIPVIWSEPKQQDLDVFLRSWRR